MKEFINKLNLEFKNPEAINEIIKSFESLMEEKGGFKESDYLSISLMLQKIDEYISFVKEKKFLNLKKQSLNELKLKKLNVKLKNIKDTIDDLIFLKRKLAADLDKENANLSSSSSYLNTAKTINDLKNQYNTIESEIENLTFQNKEQLNFFIFDINKNDFVLEPKNKDLELTLINNILKDNGFTLLSRAKIEQSGSQNINLFGDDDLYDE